MIKFDDDGYSIDLGKKRISLTYDGYDSYYVIEIINGWPWYEFCRSDSYLHCYIPNVGRNILIRF